MTSFFQALNYFLTNICYNNGLFYVLYLFVYQVIIDQQSLSISEKRSILVFIFCVIFLRENEIYNLEEIPPSVI